MLALTISAGLDHVSLLREALEIVESFPMSIVYSSRSAVFIFELTSAHVEAVQFAKACPQNR